MSPYTAETQPDDEGIDLPFDPETDLFWFYVIGAGVKLCAAEFYLNGIVLSLNSLEQGYYFAQPVNQYIIDGENELAFIVKPGSRPSLALSGPPEGKTEAEAYINGPESVAVRLCRYPYGALVGGPDQQILRSLSWPQEQSAPGNSRGDP